MIHVLPQVAAVGGSGPTVDITVGSTADEYADSMYPTKAYGVKLILYIGNSYDRVQNVTGPARIYIQFDLSEIPRQTHIVSADMQLYQMFAPASSQTYEVHMVQSAWNESTVTWITQPTSDSAVVSAGTVPAEKDVWVSWDVTSAAQAWANGEAPNYGLMIKINNEKRGVANEASGFYAREYPKEELRPKLHILLRSEPPYTYVFSIHVAGLPAELSTAITVDGKSEMKVPGRSSGYLLFGSGTEHVIMADEYVKPSGPVRYQTKTYSTTVSGEGEFTFSYEPQYLVTVSSNPSGLIDREWSEWYDPGARVQTPTAQEAFDKGPDVRVGFAGWYINDVKQSGNPITLPVEGPADITARYVTQYNFTVTSQLGNVSGPGWHMAGSSVDISVTPAYLPAQGVLGYLGFGSAFDHWTGSFESTSPTIAVTVDKPVHVTAVWREDRTWFVVGIGVVIAVALVLGTILLRSKRSKYRESSNTRKR